MTSAAVSTQALNRAPLARQRLLARTPLPADSDRAAHVLRLVRLNRMSAVNETPPGWVRC